MKFIKFLMVMMAAAMITLALGGNGLAFHGGGVAHCDGCHTMHNSEGGEAVIEGSAPGKGLNSSLTIGSDPSSTCLSCHEGNGSYHVASEGGEATPNLTAGGDFYWLQNNYKVELRPGVTQDWKGESFGHNIVALDFGYVKDGTLSGAPSINGPNGFPSDALACSSCHDPHGKIERTGTTYKPIVVSGSYGGLTSRGDPVDLVNGVMGNYRLLGTSGYNPNGAVGAFKNPAPIAYATNASGFYGSKVDYGSGMSEWCANCHTGFNQVSSQTTQHLHPAANEAALNGQATNYNRYVATGDLTGDSTTSYLGLVPFERGVTYNPEGYVGELDPVSTEGPNSGSNVMCLSCHRAHANGFRNAGRWDFETELLVDSLPNPTSGNYPYGQQYGYYYGGARIDIATDFNAGQRSLCNKCHIQD